MKILRSGIISLCMVGALFSLSEIQARGIGGGGRGGGGGGGRSFGGGGGRSIGGGGGGRPNISRPSAPSISRPTSRPSTPSINRPSSRPSTPSINRPSGGSRPSLPSSRPGSGNRPSIQPGNRPSGLQPGSRPSIQPGNRPNIQPGNRPSLQPGNRPSGLQPGSRPSITPGNRPSTMPGIDTGRPGGSNRPGTGIDTGRPLPSRPSQRPSRPGGGDRPNLPGIGDRPGSGDRPNLPGLGDRPGSGDRPGRPGDGDRPGIGDRPGRPGDGDRPGIGDRPGRPGDGDRPGIGDRPGRPGDGDRPGIGDRPGRPGDGDRPGIGDRPGRPGDGDRPGIGDRPGRPENRPSFDERRDNLQDRMNNRDDRYSNRQDRWDDRQDHWNDWHDRHYHYHNHWHNGHWHGGYYPGARWNYWWDNYPVMSAFGVTTWAVNRVGWAFGYNNYYNPYVGSSPVYVDNSSYSYDYSQPIVMTPDETSLDIDPTTYSSSTAPNPAEESLSSFDEARVSFYDGNYQAALKQTDEALKASPNDTVIHEFRALVTFALKDYGSSAATLYAVLSVGPGWDWTTMSGLYPSVSVYTDQLRALESHCKSNSSDMAARFVLAYHYITAGHNDAAVTQLKKIVAANPKDQVSTQLLMQLDPDAEIPNLPKQVEPPQPTQTVSTDQYIGSWTAKRENSEFDMSLKENKEFSWAYTAEGKTQTVQGIWSVDEKGVLALEMNDEGVMLAQTVFEGNGMDFYMLGDSQGSDPLKFQK